MSGSKYFDRIAVIVTAITLIVTILFMNGAALGIEVAATTMGYENRLFDNTKVHTVDIVTNEWDDMIDNAASEEYYKANVVIDGESYKNVGIRTKGNTSLSTVATLGSERYSFKIEFDHYDKNKSYHGLDKLSLNNLIQDSTMMKDYLTYTMMNEFGVNSSLCSYVYITVNGEDWGLYLAVEGVEEAFLERNYGSDCGELYKPDSMSFGGGRGNGGDFDIGDFNFGEANGDASDKNGFGEFDMSSDFGGKMPDMPFSVGEKMPNGFDGSDIPEDFAPSDMFGDKDGKGGGFGGMGSDDVKLKYIDDETSSYSNIWNNAKTDVTEADQTRLIESLKKLSVREDTESVVDTEQVIRYFVVHNYVCNGDSYTGSMVHNYYLYEKDGKLAMIPWDYNLAYGTFQSGNATETVNTPIDSPVDNGSGEDRPMWNWIVSDEEYTQLYHQYFAEFLSSVDIDGIIDNAYNLIKDYVAKDPTAFYTYDEFELGVKTIRAFCTLRSESISMQLENGETSANMSYADASDINLSDMGSMGGGDMPGTPDSNGGGAMPNMPDNTDKFNGFASNGSDVRISRTSSESVENNMPSDGNFHGRDFDNGNGNVPPDISGAGGGNNMSGAFPDDLPDDFDPSDMPSGGNFPGQASDDVNGDAPSDTSEENGENADSRPSGGNMQMPGGDFSFDTDGNHAPESDASAWIWIGVSVAILALGLITAKKYKG